ncbi:hypothetical protein SAMN04487911_102177 [Arenibacter nanhaiticus]|uniref:TonB protein C-terminal n=1 Tax=Arenibacter nanhaiticus TaxID=558155 RepID=A0A1M6BFA8_9FLAO|nr:hypothetical protein [Arenibacter nanhaiticus]SHI47430.1 hypothetical protein SAMN04487911_102177 [Arenibacter nanhaiticus]
MKKISVFLLLALFFAVSNVEANDLLKPHPKKELSDKISELLQDHQLAIQGESVSAKVLFTFNKEQEVVVLSVSTNYEPVEAFLKDRLNYRKIDAFKDMGSQFYTVNVRLVP